MNSFNSFSIDRSILLAQDFLSSLVNSAQGKDILPSAFGNSFALDAASAWIEVKKQKHYAHFTKSQIASIKAPRDRASVVMDDRLIQIEQATPKINPAFDLIGLTQLRNDPQFATIDGSGFSVAVIDTGIDTDHSLLAPNYVAGFDFLDNDGDPNDIDGHGTHVAGIIGAADENVGVAPGVDLIGLRVLNDSNGSVAEVEDALEWVYDNRDQYNITAVNLSLGLGFYTTESGIQGDILSDDIQRLESVGITVVSAAGNDYFANSGELNQENLAFPAISSTLAVGAVWRDGAESNVNWQDGSIDYTTSADRIASFSQRLDTPSVLFAPGALITSTLPGGGLGVSAGTSQASPHVAGAIALIQQASLEFSGRLLTPEEIREIFIVTGEPIVDGDDEDDNIVNTGETYVRINVYNAIAEVKARSDNLAPPPDNNSDDLVAGDSNGTIAGAFIGPTLDGSPGSALVGTIGRDSANLRDSDVDIYSFQVVSPGIVGIEVTTNLDNPNDFDSYLRLFDANGNEIASNDDLAATDGFSGIDVTLEPGTYYVGISGVGNVSYDPNIAGSGIAGDTGNYALELSLNNQDPNGFIGGAQPVSLGNDLEPLMFPGVIGSDYGEAIGISDVDLLQVVAPDNGTLFIDIDTPFATEFVDSYLRLFDRDGNEILGRNQQVVASDNDLAVNSNGVAVEFAAADNSGIILENPSQTELVSGFNADGVYQQGNYGHNTDSFVAVRVQRGQVYYIGISDVINQDYNATNLDNRPENGTGGNYELTTTFVNNDLNGSITQINEVTPLPIVNRTEAIGADGEQEVGDRDVDFYKVNSGSAGILEIATTSGVEDPINTVVIIFDSQGKRLGLNGRPNSLNSVLRYQIAPNTDYYVGVTGYGNQNFDPFGLGSGTGGDTGTYSINGSLIPLEEAGNLVDNIIGSSAVQNITSGETLLGNIGNDSGFVVGDTDVDIYRFVPTQSNTVNIRTVTSEEFSADTYLRVFDRNGNEIAANNDASDIDRGSLIQLDVIADTEYYLGISGNSPEGQQYNAVTGEGTAPGSQGNYSLSVSSGNDLVTGSTVYRFFRPDVGVHFYTASEAERDSIINNLAQYSYEGESYLAASETADPLTGARPVYRFFNNSTGAHLYTMSEAERDSISGSLPNYTYEGVAYYGYESDRPGATPLYRFYNPVIDAHFYTPSALERDSILATLPDYRLESGDGIAFYVEPIGQL